MLNKSEAPHSGLFLNYMCALWHGSKKINSSCTCIRCS